MLGQEDKVSYMEDTNNEKTAEDSFRTKLAENIQLTNETLDKVKQEEKETPIKEESDKER